MNNHLKLVKLNRKCGDVKVAKVFYGWDLFRELSERIWNPHLLSYKAGRVFNMVSVWCFTLTEVLRKYPNQGNLPGVLFLGYFTLKNILANLFLGQWVNLELPPLTASNFKEIKRLWNEWSITLSEGRKVPLSPFQGLSNNLVNETKNQPNIIQAVRWAKSEPAYGLFLLLFSLIWNQRIKSWLEMFM